VGEALRAGAVTTIELRASMIVGQGSLSWLFWGALRATTSSLVPTLVAHLMWDVLVLLWLPLDSR
jgi:hypothetical protein